MAASIAWQRVRLGLVQQPFRQRGFREQARKRDPVELVHRVEPRDVLGNGRPGAARPSEQCLQLGMTEGRAQLVPRPRGRGQQLSCVRRLARGSEEIAAHERDEVVDVGAAAEGVVVGLAECDLGFDEMQPVERRRRRRR